MHKKKHPKLKLIEYAIDNIIFLIFINLSNQFSYFINQSDYKVKRIIKKLGDLTNSIMTSPSEEKDTYHNTYNF